MNLKDDSTEDRLAQLTETMEMQTRAILENVELSREKASSKFRSIKDEMHEMKEVILDQMDRRSALTEQKLSEIYELIGK